MTMTAHPAGRSVSDVVSDVLAECSPHTVTSLHTGANSPLLAHRIIAATELVYGRAVIVICEGDDDIVAIGSFVRSRSTTHEYARAAALEHALRRIAQLRERFSSLQLRGRIEA